MTATLEVHFYEIYRDKNTLFLQYLKKSLFEKKILKSFKRP